MDMTVDDLRRILVASAGDPAENEITEATLDTRFDILGYDSLALIETITRIGREFGLVIPDSELTDLQTPRAVLDRVRELAGRG